MYSKNRTKISLVFLIILSILSLNVLTVSATSNFSGGNGTKQKPYLVSNYSQLMKVKKYNGCYFRQTKDIVCNYEKITQLFGSGSFYGVYNGDGYVIKNILVSDAEAYLFPAIDEHGSILNVTFEDITFNGNNGAALIGKNMGKLSKIKMVNCSFKAGTGVDSLACAAPMCITNGKKGVISSCRVKDTSVNVATNAWEALAKGAGLCIKNQGTIKKNILSEIKINIKSEQYFAYAGGFVVENVGRLTSCQLTLAETASCTGDSNGNYGAPEYGYMGRLVYRNTGVIQSCSTVGNFSDDKASKNCYKNRGVIR